MYVYNKIIYILYIMLYTFHNIFKTYFFYPN